MADGVISYEEATGASPIPPAAASSTSAPGGVDADGYRTITVHPGAAPVPPPVPPQQQADPQVSGGQSASAPSAPASPSAPSGIISYEDATTPDTPNPGGALSNSADDGYASGALKGLGTAAVKGISDTIGVVGGLSNFADYLVARAQSKITGEPVDSVLAKIAKAKQEQQAHAAAEGIPAWANPANVLPAPTDVANPILKQTGEYVPTTEPGKIAQGAAEAAFAGLVPGFGAASVERQIAQTALAPARSWVAAKDILQAAPSMAAGNAAAGGVGQGVTDVTQDPLLGMAAGVVGGAAAHGGASAVKNLAAPAVMGIPGIDNVPIIGPRVAAARENAAAGQVLAQSSDPAALRDWAAQPAPVSDIPNSPQTTAATVGNDRGLFQAEKDARNVNNLPFNAVDRAQSNAQQAVIQGAQPEGDVFRPGQVIRQRLDAIDAASQEAQDRLTAAHQDAVTQRQMASQAYADQQRAALADRTIARGEASGDQKAQADAARQAAHDDLVQAFQGANDQAAQVAADASAPLRDRTKPEETGATLRTALQEAHDSAKQVRKQAFDAVDPNETLAVVVSPIKEAKAALQQKIDPHVGVHPAGDEADLWKDIDRLPDVVPFKTLQELDARVTQAMRNERQAQMKGESKDPQALGRLTALKSATMDAIHNGVENQAAHEARLVEAGLMQPADTMEARFGQTLRQEADAWKAARADAVGFDSGGRASGYPVGRASRVSGIGGAEGENIGRSSNAQGNPGVSPLQPNFDQGAVDRLDAAKAVHAEFAQTYRNPTIKPILETNGYVGQYKLSDGSLPAKAIVQGDKGFETANTFLRAAKNDPRAIGALQDAALAPLRKNVPPVGNLHPNALARWKEAYGPALRAIDAVSPGFSDRFDNAANATQALLDVGAQQKQALSDLQRESARQAVIENISRREALGQATQADRTQVASLLAERAADDRAAIAQSKATTSEGIAQARGIAKDAKNTPAGQFASQGGDRIAPTEVENAVGNMLKTGTEGAVRMRSLVSSVAQDPEALAGLRKAGVDWIIRSHQNADGSMSGAKFIGFIRNNRDVLKELYSSKDVSMWGAIADRIEADARWRTETAIKGGSDTGKNIRPMLEKAVDDTKRHVSIMGAATAGFLAGGPKGAAAGAGLFLLNNLRSAGIRGIDDLYREALLDPEKARFLISKMPESAQGGKLGPLTGALRRSLIVGQQQVSNAGQH